MRSLIQTELSEIAVMSIQGAKAGWPTYLSHHASKFNTLSSRSGFLHKQIPNNLDCATTMRTIRHS